MKRGRYFSHWPAEFARKSQGKTELGGKEVKRDLLIQQKRPTYSRRDLISGKRILQGSSPGHGAEDAGEATARRDRRGPRVAPGRDVRPARGQRPAARARRVLDAGGPRVIALWRGQAGALDAAGAGAGHGGPSRRAQLGLVAHARGHAGRRRPCCVPCRAACRRARAAARAFPRSERSALPRQPWRPDAAPRVRAGQYVLHFDANASLGAPASALADANFGAFLAPAPPRSSRRLCSYR